MLRGSGSLGVSRVNTKKLLCRASSGQAPRYDVDKMMAKYPIGLEANGFKVQRVVVVPEFSLTAVELSHERTGALHLHIDRDDKNNVFGIIFKTNPPNKTGVAHILEHTTLCGSEKYPVRDPFFKMLNRSLANFMNAMTAHDHTFYPFATTNKIDYKNLTDVYLDSTLKPLLREEDFQQEGWRLENENLKDKESPLIFKGVVYNEMKGQVSNSSYFFWIKFQESIYPSLNNSGGDPTKITDLTYWDLLDFHKQNYHPSNSKIFTYGDLKLIDILEKLNKNFKNFGKRSNKNIVKKHMPLLESKNIIIEGPIDTMVPLDKQFKTSITWYAGDPKDVYNTFLLKILSTLLNDGHSAPFYQELIEKGIGIDFSINSGVESMPEINLFTVGLQGLNEENSNKLEEIINDILIKVIEKGFESKRIQAIIQQLEISKKMESAEFGMNLLYSLIPGWVNDVDPLEMLKFNETIAKLNKDFIKKGDKIFIELIEKYLIKKPNFKFSMKPAENFQDLIIKEEQLRLNSKIKNLNDNEKKLLYERALKLENLQNEKEDLKCLPTLTVNDIPTRGDFVKVDVNENNITNSKCYKRFSPKTNGLTYFRALKTLGTEIPVDLIPYLPLFTECLTNLGTTDKSMSELEEEIKLYTGGISSSVSVSSSPFNIDEPILRFVLTGVAQNKNFNSVLKIWNTLLKETDFEKNLSKLSILIKSLANDNLNEIISSGHSFAKSYSSSKFSSKAVIDESLNGIKQVEFLNKLNKWNEEGLLLEKVVPNLIKLQELIVNKDNFRIMLTCDESIALTNEKLADDFINGLPSRTGKINSDKPTWSSLLLPSTLTKGSRFKNLIEIPSQVNFTSLSRPGIPYVTKDGASLQILSQILTFKKLHKEIREKGGAYGGGSSYDAINGIFNFYSYRDPNPTNSLQQFNDVMNNYIDKSFATTESFALLEEVSDDSLITTRDLDQAKLSIFQQIDAPISVREEGLNYFVHGINDQIRQERRDHLLNADLNDIKSAAEKFLVHGEGPTSEVIIGTLKDEDSKLISKKSGWNKVKLGVFD
ncbi:hypothetical protein PACTADRAFT_49825 [Pachysolen tannophilus NRRL Y-2460]|uniref:Presequence protease, mitochondrial n=1 Tax=Pachysolen tannophilus NRRL Y-2460 TaxID=669874 RepID=A0A1E4TXU9_PACTA|nr:hypothetical protein PACTADRAFT_49825 [Pachysolen tannophilus NRRL Y-2460]